MTDDKKGNSPDYVVSTPVKGKDDKTFWIRVGSAWKKGDDISIKLNALPIGDALYLAKPEEKKE